MAILAEINHGLFFPRYVFIDSIDIVHFLIIDVRDYDGKSKQLFFRDNLKNEHISISGIFILIIIICRP